MIVYNCGVPSCCEVSGRVVSSGQSIVAASEDDRLAWLALILSPGVGQMRAIRARSRMGRASDIFDASLTQLEGFGLPVQAVRFLADGEGRNSAVRELELVRESGGDILTYDCASYPQRLLDIYDPPAVLWYRGDASVLSLDGIGVVGTRHPSAYGQTMSQMLARDLAARGLAIFSGMARGVDTFAHKGALEAGGKTAAVWGTGIDVIYPKENKRLAEEILANGGVIVSEYPMGTFPAPQNFPIRNRIISGMSVGVLVIEAGENSGTRVTARCALEQGRDVYAVPGNVTNKQAWGPNLLIKQGAKLTATWEDVWEDLPSDVRLRLEDRLTMAGVTETSASGEASLYPNPDRAMHLSSAEQQVYAQLRLDEAMQLDDLIEGLQDTLPPPEIFNALFELELAGRIRQMPGKNYLRAF